MLADLANGLVNRREWRMKIPGHRHIIKTGNGNIPTHAKASGHCGMYGPDGDLITDADDGRRPTAGRQ